jgi:hypothetical protein
MAEQASWEARIKHLIDRLEASYPEQSAQPSQIEATPTFLLDTTPDEFTAWLRQKSRSVRKRRFPMAGGYLLLQEARRPKKQEGDTGDLIVLMIDGLLYEGGATFLQYKQILFTIFPLAEGGIAVQAKCNQPAVALYYAELLADLTKHYAPSPEL